MKYLKGHVPQKCKTVKWEIYLDTEFNVHYVVSKQ